jgi:hypothetical protein
LTLALAGDGSGEKSSCQRELICYCPARLRKKGSVNPNHLCSSHRLSTTNLHRSNFQRTNEDFMRTWLAAYAAGCVLRRKSPSGFPHLTWACSAIVAIMAILVGQIAPPKTSCSGASFHGQMVNRAEKGDRLISRSPFHSNTVNQPWQIDGTGTPGVGKELLDGCESLISPLAGARQIPGRCLS